MTDRLALLLGLLLCAQAHQDCPIASLSPISSHESGVKTIVLTVIDKNVAYLAPSYLANIKRTKTTATVCLIALAPEVVEAVPSAWYPANTPNILAYCADCIRSVFLCLYCFRVFQIKRALELGYEVVSSDLDAEWLQDPIPLLQSYTADIAIGSGISFPKVIADQWGLTLCMGFVFYRPTSSELLKHLTEYLLDPGELDDQVWINTFYLRNGPPSKERMELMDTRDRFFVLKRVRFALVSQYKILRIGPQDTRIDAMVANSDKVNLYIVHSHAFPHDLPLGLLPDVFVDSVGLGNYDKSLTVAETCRIRKEENVKVLLLALQSHLMSYFLLYRFAWVFALLPEELDDGRGRRGCQKNCSCCSPV